MKFTYIEYLIVATIILIVTAIGVSIYTDYNDKKEFIVYCTSKGNDPEDCKWEWKRIESGKKSTIIFMRY